MVSAGGNLLVTSMDEEQVFGPVAYTYPFSRGTAEVYQNQVIAAQQARKLNRHQEQPVI